VVFLLQHLRDAGDLGITMETTGGKVVILLSTIGHVEGECHQRGLGHVWKSACNHWLPY
jgi:hypothetical protein